MNAALLLEHYAQIADASDGITRLRRFVLDLAVRGKLVEQCENDEPVVNVLARHGAGLPLHGAFVVPRCWSWINVGSVARTRLGKMLDKAKNKGTSKPYLRNINVRWFGFDLNNLLEMPFEDRELSEFSLFPGDVLICEGGEPGRAAVWRAEVDGIYFQKAIHRARFAAFVDPDYFVLALRSSANDGRLEESFTGTGIQHFTGRSLDAYKFPLPPLAEQHRIVAKVDELMGLCDQLEAARAGREAARDTFALSTLARLNTPDPETIAADAGFTLANLAPLTTRADQIKQLRQTILNLAVRGKLVKQDGMDEPAKDLVQRIQRPIQCLTQNLRLKAPKLPAISDNQAPFELPIGWCWARFPELGAFGRGRSKHRPRNDPALYTDGEHRMIQTGDVARSKGLIQTHTAKYNDVGLAQSRLWPKGTLCITIAANIADSGTLDFAACFPDSVVGFVPAPCFESARYFEYFMRTAKADLLAFAPATAQKNINLDILMQVMIPLPPLAEQHRIVAKVDQLMTLCDHLEASLTNGEQTLSRLMKAVLHNALEPA